MRTLEEWRAGIKENAKRTSLGHYPRAYGPAGTHPPLDSMTHKAGAAGDLERNHPDVLKDTNPPAKAKKMKKK